jgi:enoyl-CoA hydratase/carnithine racemase
VDTPDLTTVAIELDGPVGRVWLDRPDKLNPLSTTTLEELAVAARWFDGRPETRVVVVGGRGRAFSAGADVASFGEPDPARSPRDAADAGRRMADAVEAAGTRFSIPEVDLGVPLAWGGIPRLVREVGPAVTKELVMTCRAFSAEEAQRLGLVNRVVAPDDLDVEVEELARSLAAKAAFPVRATKRHVDALTAAMVGTARSWNDADALLTALRDPDCRAAGARYLEGLGRKG